MGIFILLTLAISAVKGQTSPKFLGVSPTDDLMLQKITLNGKEIWVIEALKGYNRMAESENKKLVEALMPLVDSKHTYLFISMDKYPYEKGQGVVAKIAYGLNSLAPDKAIDYTNEGEGSTAISAPDISKISTASLLINGERWFIYYYLEGRS